MNRAVVGVVGVILNPIKYLSYYLGHRYGRQEHESSAIDDEIFGDFAPFVDAIYEEFQKAWDARYEWDGLNGLNGLLNIILKILSSVGMDIKLDYSENGNSSYVNFPFSPQTLPGGENTYQMMKLQGLI